MDIGIASPTNKCITCAEKIKQHKDHKDYPHDHAVFQVAELHSDHL